jgi:tetratricopeptide (TPR) repeat protein
MELEEQPDHPFTLFNVGSVYRELGRSAEALPHLQKSLAKSHSTDSIVRKLHSLIGQCLRDVKQPAEAVKACAEGRKAYPDDPELLFLEAVAREETGDFAGAESCLRRLIEGSESDNHFASINPGLRRHLGRNQLGWLLHHQKRHAEAEAQWRVALTEQPRYIPALLGLAEAYLQLKRWEALEQVIEQLNQHPNAAVLRGRAKMARKEYGPARWALSQAAERYPTMVEPRIYLSHAILQEGLDWAAAERALRDVLNVDPANTEAKNNLEVLLREHPQR